MHIQHHLYKCREKLFFRRISEHNLPAKKQLSVIGAKDGAKL